MAMHRNRHGGNQDFHPYRHPRPPSRFSDGHPTIRPNPRNYKGDFYGEKAHPSLRPFNNSHLHPGTEVGVGAGGFPMPPVGDFNLNPHVPMPEQKRPHPFSERGGPSPPDYFDKAGIAKLFVGSIPRTSTEKDILPLFERHGNVLEVALIKDKKTGQQQGCCFVKYATSQEADRAIRALHNQYTLPGGFGPIQVRYADGERERLGAAEQKLFVGSLNRLATEQDVDEIFSPFGKVEDVYIMRDEVKRSRGCGFIKFAQRDMAVAAIDALNGIYTMRGCDQPLIVRFADPKRPRAVEARDDAAPGVPDFGQPPTAPGLRLEQGFNDQIGAPVPSNLWHSVSTPPTAGLNRFGDYLHPMSRDAAPSSSWEKNIFHSDLAMGAPQQLSLRPSCDIILPQMRPSSHHLSLVQKPQISPQHLPVELHPHAQASYPRAYLRQNESAQAFPPAQQVGVLPTANVISQSIAVMNQHQSSIPAQQQILQRLPQSPSQLIPFLSQEPQAKQESFQQHPAFNQLPQQYLSSHTSNQSAFPMQRTLNSEQQQSQWSGLGQQAAVSADVPYTAATNCNWTEHTSPDGYKYYYNSVTGESRWEKPEELMLHEQRQLQLKFPVEQVPPQLQAQGQYSHQISQAQLLQYQTHYQVQNQQPFLSSSASAIANYQNARDSSTLDKNSLLFLQGAQAPQGWIPTMRPTGV